MGEWLNPRWDTGFATSRVEDLGLELHQRAGMLSGSQRAQLALTLAVAKRPELLLLDDPVASLDPSRFCSHRRGRVRRLSVRSLGLTSGSGNVADRDVETPPAATTSRRQGGTRPPLPADEGQTP